MNQRPLPPQPIWERFSAYLQCFLVLSATQNWLFDTFLRSCLQMLRVCLWSEYVVKTPSEILSDCGSEDVCFVALVKVVGKVSRINICVAVGKEKTGNNHAYHECAGVLSYYSVLRNTLTSPCPPLNSLISRSR